ncbi:transmembrane 9 superfamily protein member 4 [Arthroderma uncinatum]|uniref:transmembrane 9 superfamily protein member 4 n=1 Tax=Arthroderma uncinatum TaxID=74035 RepID=UPI00144AA0C6|nr:transmembrane 9 superfamily protein member 4 [Arthroderma uncinatum]KAF3490619.1 transmembrane 9 superfamily protein member 4 [Arthroderma uncinatum]
MFHPPRVSSWIWRPLDLLAEEFPSKSTRLRPSLTGCIVSLAADVVDVKLEMDFKMPAYLLSFLLLFSQATAFYVPGYSIDTYQDGQRIPVLVNKIFSDSSQLQYAYSDLPFACPSTGKLGGQSVSLNLGEILRGDRIVVSDFELAMGQNVACKPLCTREIGRKHVKWAKRLISDGFVAEWIVDNLPGATSFTTVDKTKKYYTTGFKLGYQALSSASRKPAYFIHNHFTFVIRWRDAPRGDGRKVIVGFEIYPKSINRDDRKQDGCPKDVHTHHNGFDLYLQPNNTRLAQQYPGSSYLPEEDDEVDDGATLSIPYTYSVFFKKEDNVEWANRWDLYLYSQQDGTATHWLSLLNSLVISGILSITVLVIWRRTVYGDAKGRGDGSLEDGKARLRSRKPSSTSPAQDEKSSNGLLDNGDLSDEDLSSEDDFEEAASWKRLHGDVFRTPAYSGLLAPFVGSGMQLLFMAIGLLSLSCLGVLNPSFRGGFISVGVGLFIFAGVFSGYFSARLYRTCGGQNWRKNTFITALLFPGLVFSLIFVLNLFVWAQASSTALPFGTLVGLLTLWLLIQVPLVYAGSWYGYERAKPWSHPTRTNAIPRQVPVQPWYSGTVRGILLAGLVPFAVLFVELVFLFRNLLQDKAGYYYVFGYLSIVCALSLASIAEMAIITTYGQLCAENHRWWWHSFMVGGSSAVWVFLYCIWYFFTKLHIRGFISSLLFFSYSFLGCAVYGLLTGTVGFLAAYGFVRRIYSSVKAD